MAVASSIITVIAQQGRFQALTVIDFKIRLFKRHPILLYLFIAGILANRSGGIRIQIRI